MLSHLVGESIVTNKPVNIFEDPNSFGQGSSESSETPSSGEGMFSMFGAPATETSTEETTEAVEEKKDTVPEIIPY
jgi:hypothetical protein